MQHPSDAQLLRDYAAHGSDPAFAGIVERHTDLVYSAALRQTGSPELARDLAQSVFTDLARKAGALARPLDEHASLAGWLYQATRFAVLTARREERRRRAREKMVMEQFDPAPAQDDTWAALAPVLDEAMAELGDTDREAVVLRYFQNRDFSAVAVALGVSEAAAQKRVSRAVERLRDLIAKRGVTTGASGLVVLISAHAVLTAPAGLSAAIAATALAGSTILTATTAVVAKAIAMTTTQKALLTTALLAFLGTAAYKAYQAANPNDSSAQAGAVMATNTAQVDNRAKPFNRFGPANNRSGQRPAPDFVKLADELRAALYNVPKTPFGTRSYPPDEVVRPLLNYGSDRKEAFVVLQEAASAPDLEVRRRAISAMGLVGMISTPQQAAFGLLGEPAPEAKPWLWQAIHASNPDLAFAALTSLQTIGFDAGEIPALANLIAGATNHLLLRYLPESIAKTIQNDPAGAAPHLAVLESMLNRLEPGLQFEAACALAKQQASKKPQILPILMSGLKSKDGTQQLMALETLQTLGSVAEPALQAILDFGDTTRDSVMKDVAFKAMGKIKSELRAGLPEVDQALRHDENVVRLQEKLMSDSYSRQELLEALKEPALTTQAAMKFCRAGPSAKDAVPDLISALAGRDQPTREKIVEAIQQIDPQAIITKVNSRPVAHASKIAALTLAEQRGPAPSPLGEMLEKSQWINSDWRTEQEVLALAKAIATQDQEAYRAFVEKLLAEDSSLTNLFSKPPSK